MRDRYLEALLRWQDRMAGRVAPRNYGPVSEGQRRACSHMRAARAERVAPRQAAMRDLRQQGFTYRQIAEQLGGTPDGVRGSLRKMQA